MTNDEAIRILQGIDRLIGDDFYSDTIEEAIELAIESLSISSSKEDLIIEGASKIPDEVYVLRNYEFFNDIHCWPLKNR